MTLKKYPIDGRRYYGEENHLLQKEFLKELHSNKGKYKNTHKKISQTLKNRYVKGTIVNPMFGKHHNIKTRKEHSKGMKLKYKKGMIPHNKGKTAEFYEPLRKMGRKVAGELNPAKRKEVRVKVSLKAKQRYREHPESHPNFKMINVSSPQRELLFLLKVKYSNNNLKMEYPIICKEGIRYADIALVSKQINFEYDEKYWHQDKEADVKRDKELREVGWKIIRYNSSQLKKLRIKLKVNKEEIKKIGVKYVV